MEVPVEVPVEVDEGLLEKRELIAPNIGLMRTMTEEEALMHITAVMNWNTVTAQICHGNLDAIREGHSFDD